MKLIEFQPVRHEKMDLLNAFKIATGRFCFGSVDVYSGQKVALTLEHMTMDELHDKLYDKLKGKPYVEWTDLVRLIEDEFHVSLVVKESPAEEDAKAIANDPDVLRQIRMSQQDRENGHIYAQEAGLEHLQNRIQGAERG
jgi:hypothetical protein